MEKLPFLISMQRVVGRVEVQDDRLAGLFEILGGGSGLSPRPSQGNAQAVQGWPCLPASPRLDLIEVRRDRLDLRTFESSPSPVEQEALQSRAHDDPSLGSQ